MTQVSLAYFDNAATTRVRPEVYDAMHKYMKDEFANPSGIYKAATAAKLAIDNAREKIAAAIGANYGNEIYFTGSGTESINWAIKSIAQLHKGCHIITSQVEHHAVLHTCEYLEKNGNKVTYLAVDKYGAVDLNQLKSAICQDTKLVTIMMANNEVGTIMPIAEIAEIIKQTNTERSADDKIIFHMDGVQALGHIPINVNDMNIDLLSVSAHKLNGPKGVGALYVKRGTKISALIHGGGQERNRRAGTENVAGIVGFGIATEMACAEMQQTNSYLKAMRDETIGKLLALIPYSCLNGHPTNRLANNINITIDFIEGEGMLLLLDARGIVASSGSACTSGSLDPSHVLLSMGLPHERAHGSLRISFDYHTTQEEIDKLIEALPPIVERLRKMSPLWEEYNKEMR